MRCCGIVGGATTGAEGEDGIGIVGVSITGLGEVTSIEGDSTCGVVAIDGTGAGIAGDGVEILEVSGFHWYFVLSCCST